MVIFGLGWIGEFDQQGNVSKGYFVGSKQYNDIFGFDNDIEITKCGQSLEENHQSNTFFVRNGVKIKLNCIKLH